MPSIEALTYHDTNDDTAEDTNAVLLTRPRILQTRGKLIGEYSLQYMNNEWDRDSYFNLIQDVPRLIALLLDRQWSQSKSKRYNLTRS